jgi:spore coat polysaccharide biosynthesis predicted glycosyltransferase SpsG
MCFGGSDPYDVTTRLGRALSAAMMWELDVVVGPDYVGRAVADRLPVVREPSDLADRFVAADIAVVGAGTMKFEAAALGVPAVLVAVADDQLQVGPLFGATGAAVWAGDGRRIDPVAVAEHVLSLLDDADRWSEMSRRGPAVVPGDGARRIVQATLNETSHWGLHGDR